MFVEKKRFKAEGFLILATLFWGATFPLTKAGLDGCSPFLFLGLRFLLASFFFAVYLGFSKKYKIFFGLSRKSIFRGILLGLVMFLGFAMQNLGLKYTSVAHSSFITYSFALYVPFLQLLFTKKRLKKANIIGLIVVLAGIWFMAFGEKGAGLNIGDLIALIGALGYALFIVLMDRFNSEESPQVMTMIQFVVTTLLGFLSALFLEDAFLTPNLGLLANFLYLSFFASVLSLFFMNKYQKDITPVHAVILYSLEPVFALVLAAIFLHEELAFVEITACLLILAGVFVSELIPLLKKKTAPLTRDG